MRSPRLILWAFLLLLPLLANRPAFAFYYDDYTPEVTARVVRISLLRGDVQIRRGGDSQTWERATLNLPIVEGDELTTGEDSRIEIQFDKDNYLRVAENSSVKFSTLRDEGVALSVPIGTVSLRVVNFDKSRGYFEMDAPSTTVSVERSGMFRIDAGDSRSNEVRVTVTEGGEARVYSQNSGFSLRNGRSARLYLSGNYAGEWETGDASRYADNFDSWVMERESVVAKRVRDSYYDRYYDRDIYGAEDLNDYGEWILTNKYGYVWRPYRSSISAYSNWSPYRYGHWRWVPFYGWTWVNDEPWGWATYHYGRWIWDDGYWHWAPYGNSRWRRSWWRPAMVSIITWNGSVCWYPLSYYDNYYDYNSGYYRRDGGRVTIINNNTTIINNNTTVVVNPTPRPSPPVVDTSVNPTRQDRVDRNATPPLQRIPPGAVVSVNADEFGKRRGGYTTPPLETGRTILSKPIDRNQTPPILPDYKDITTKVSKEILIENPPPTSKYDTVKTGATDRKNQGSLDEELRRTKIYGDRTPLNTKTDPGNGGGIIVNPNSDPRNTGAVNRRLPRENVDDRKNENPPVFNPGPTRQTGGKTDESQQPQRKPRETPRDENQTPPIWVQPETKRDPQQKPREEPRYNPPPKPREEPRYEPPPKPREQPRYDPPPKPREEPRPQPQPKPRDEPRPQPQQKPREEQKPPQQKPSENRSKSEDSDN